MSARTSSPPLLLLSIALSACSSGNSRSAADAGTTNGGAGGSTASNGGALAAGGVGGSSSGGRDAGSSAGATAGAGTSSGGTSSGNGAGGTTAVSGGASGASSSGGASGANAGTGGASGANGGNGGASGAPTVERLYVAGAATSGNGSVLTEYDVTTDPVTLKKGPSLTVDGLTSFLAFSPSGDRLYSTDENGGMLRSFKLDVTTGAPSVLNAVMTAGHPTHVAIDSGSHFVFGADYNEGKVEVVGLDATGALTTWVDAESPGSQTHEVVLSPDGKFAFVPCKGSDKVAQFHFDATTGALDANTPPSVASAGGAGPRHMAFGPQAGFAYVIDENGNTMETMAYDAAAGSFTRKGALTTLPSGFSGSSTAAEVAVAPSGRFLYGSNRIVNANGDIVIYAIAQDGSLSLVAHQDTHGMQPRHFSIDPTGKLLFVANLDSKSLAVFTLDVTTGKPTFVTQTDVAMQPYYAAVNPHAK